jgi:hypothetical protein
MSVVFATTLAAIGGVVSLIGAIWLIVRSGFALTNATRENTKAVQELNGNLRQVVNDMVKIRERLAFLEGQKGGLKP